MKFTCIMTPSASSLAMTDMPIEPTDYSSHLGDSILIFYFIKSPLSVNQYIAGHAGSCQL